MSTKPTFSVICPCYNQEKYVSDSIKSVLNQTEQDFELIIIDDFSTDNSVYEISKQIDRVSLIEHKFNKGVNSCLNDAFEMSKGDYIVFTSADDILCPTHLSEMKLLFQNNKLVDSIYCTPIFIKSDGELMSELFTIKGYSRTETLRRMFLFGNQLFSPGMAVRRTALEKIMPLNNSFVQYQDYAMHIQLLSNGNFLLTSKKLIKYRWHGANLSSECLATFSREKLETDKLMDLYLKIEDISLIKDIFSVELNVLSIPLSTETKEFVLARLAMFSPMVERQAWGYKKIMKLMDNDDYYAMLHDKLQFDFKSFLALADTIHDVNRIKYKKYKKLFNNVLFIVILLVFCMIFSAVICWFT